MEMLAYLWCELTVSVGCGKGVVKVGKPLGVRGDEDEGKAYLSVWQLPFPNVCHRFLIQMT